MFDGSIKKNFLKVLYPLIGLIIILELFFQIVFIADIKFFKKPILFFNPYCDQHYWNHIDESSFNEDIFKYHPTLTLIKKTKDANCIISLRPNQSAILPVTIVANALGISTAPTIIPN